MTSTAMLRTSFAVARRLSWGLADQAVASATNFAVGVVVARSLGAVGFGVFSLAWVTYGVVINLSRGLATDPLAVRFSGVSPEEWRDATTRSSGTALAIGIAVGAVCAIIGLLIGGPIGSGFVGLGLVLPALLLQDSWRFAFFAAGQGHRAFASDVVWALALVPSLLMASVHGTVFGFMLAWGSAAAVAAVFGSFQARLLPRFGGIGAWLRQQRDLGLRYMIENVSNSGGAQLRMYGLGAIAGLGAVGAVRGGELLLGPFLAVLMGLSLVAVPEAARVLRRSPRRLPVFCLLLGGGQAVAALLWGLTLLFVLPDRLGAYVLGDVWPAAAALIVPLTLTVMNSSFSTGAAAGLRALGSSRRSLRAQLLATSAYVVCGVLGAVAGGALGSAWGLTVATLFAASVWWWQLRAGLHEHHPGPHRKPVVARQEKRKQ